jgi:hypothetical protein
VEEEGESEEGDFDAGAAKRDVEEGTKEGWELDRGEEVDIARGAGRTRAGGLFRRPE